MIWFITGLILVISGTSRLEHAIHLYDPVSWALIITGFILLFRTKND